MNYAVIKIEIKTACFNIICNHGNAMSAMHVYKFFLVSSVFCVSVCVLVFVVVFLLFCVHNFVCSTKCTKNK